MYKRNSQMISNVVHFTSYINFYYLKLVFLKSICQHQIIRHRKKQSMDLFVTNPAFKFSFFFQTNSSV